MQVVIEVEDRTPDYFSTSLWNSTNFEEVVCQYETRLYRFIYPLVQDRQLVQDLVQDTFYNAYHNLLKDAHRRQQYFEQTPAEANFTAWLYTIARNNALSALRRRQNSPQIPATSRVTNPAATGEEFDWFENIAVSEPEKSYENNLAQREALLQAINQVGQKRVVPLLLHVEGFSYQEIARITGKTLGGVKSEIFRVKKNLRTILL